jgi:hypothetical protein
MSERCCGGDHQSQNVPALLHIDEKSRVGTAKRVRCDGSAIDKNGDYTDCNERNSWCS